MDDDDKGIWLVAVLGVDQVIGPKAPGRTVRCMTCGRLCDFSHATESRFAQPIPGCRGVTIRCFQCLADNLRSLSNVRILPHTAAERFEAILATGIDPASVPLDLVAVIELLRDAGILH